MRKTWLLGLAAIVLLPAPAKKAAAQGPPPVGPVMDCGSSNQPAPPLLPSAEPYRGNSEGMTDAQRQAWQIYKAQVKEQKMEKDAAKLVQLAARLNAEVAERRASALTPAELREVAKIEKLARSVRTKMMMQ